MASTIWQRTISTKTFFNPTLTSDPAEQVDPAIRVRNYAMETLRRSCEVAGGAVP